MYLDVVAYLDVASCSVRSFLLLQVFSNLLIYLNSSTNFIIFAIMGRRFRQTLRRHCCKRDEKPRLSALSVFRDLPRIVVPNIQLSTVTTVSSALNLSQISAESQSSSDCSCAPRNYIPGIATKLTNSTKSWELEKADDIHVSNRNTTGLVGKYTVKDSST